jgi:hypothetical protein
MMTPQQPKGAQAGAASKVQVARRMLEQALIDFGSDSKEGGAILKAISGLAGAFKRSEDEDGQIMPAELKSALLQRGPSGAPSAPKPKPTPAPAASGGMPAPA